jgi:hypothetical protein
VAGDAKAQLIEGLNEDLKGEFQAIIMYRLFASMVQGPYRQELRAFFANEIPEELRHAQVLADKISAGHLAAVAVAGKWSPMRRPCSGRSSSRARDHRALRQAPQAGRGALVGSPPVRYVFGRVEPSR